MLQILCLRHRAFRQFSCFLHNLHEFVASCQPQALKQAWLQELYGGRTAGDLLSSLSRLWTIFLQGNGFTCGIGDLLLNPAAELKRAELTAQAERKATCASAEIVGISTEELQDVNDSNVGVFPLSNCIALKMMYRDAALLPQVQAWQRLHFLCCHWLIGLPVNLPRCCSN